MGPGDRWIGGWVGGAQGRGGWWVSSTVSAGELPLVSFPLVDVLEEFGFAHIFGLLVAEAAATASFLQLDAFAAVHVWRESCG